MSKQINPIKMINVGHKSVTLRTAEASGSLLLRPMTLEHIRSGKLAKGDAINTAQVAGIMAAKRTADFVPLCHPLPLDSVDVDDRVRVSISTDYQPMMAFIFGNPTFTLQATSTMQIAH